MRIVILANVPVWTLPDLEHLRHSSHYATWLEPLIPEFASYSDLDIHWITMCKETKEDLIHKAHGQTFHILSRGSMALQMATGYIGEIRRIRRRIQQLNPDVIHAWGSEDAYGLAGACSGVENRIFTLQGCLTEYLRLLGGGLLFRLQTLYEKPTVRRYRQATAESPGAAELLQELNPALQVSLIDYGVNPAFFDARWNPAKEPEVLFLGSVSSRKGIADLIAIAKRPDLAHVKFKIAGEGELRRELAEHSSPNVEWLGKCARPEVIAHLESAWALVIPTYADTGPTVVKEARVVGLPIVTTTGAGASSYVIEGDCGYVAAPGDVESFAAGIRSLCQSREEPLARGASSWQEHRELLHSRTTARKLAALYHTIAQRA